MGSIDKYIFRTTLASFALVLVSLTGVIWITQALRQIDLMTSEGQTIVTFLGFSSLVIPALVLIIAPIALMIAISHTLTKLATDSEIIVMNAAGEFIELQGTGEEATFTDTQLAELLALGKAGIRELLAAQQAAIAQG